MANKTKKSKVKKISLSLYLTPTDALTILTEAYNRGMITPSMYALKGQRIAAEFDLVKKTAEKDD